MELSALQAFHAVAARGSLSAASDDLLVTQPTLSRRIQALEAELGVRLFHRTGRGMALTDQGRTFEAWTAEATTRLLRAAEEIADSDGDQGGLLRLGLLPTVGAALTGDIVERIAAQLPGVRLRIREAYSSVLIDALHRDTLDLALIYGNSADLHLQTQVIASEELAAIASPGLLPDGPASLAGLAQAAMVLPSTSHGLRTLVDQAFADAGLTTPVGLEADGFDGLKELVRRGHGATVLPTSSVHAELASGELVSHRIEPTAPTRALALARPIGGLPSRSVVVAAQIVVDTVREMVRGG